MTCDIRNYNSALKKDWDDFVESSKIPNFLFLRDYIDYHAHRFTDASVMVYAAEKIVAVFPANIVDSVVVSHGGLTYGGIIYGTASHAADVMAYLNAIVAHFRLAGVSKVIYKAVPSIFAAYPSEEALYWLIQSGATLYRRDLSSVIELENRPRFSDSRKSSARRASKSGAIIIESDDFAAFYSLLSSVLSKFGAAPVHSESELLLLKNRFPERIRLFCVVLDEILLAAALIYDFGNVVHTQYLSNSDRGRDLGALDYLLIHLIENTFARRRYFSFGISTEDGGRVLNEGLARQKEGFGGRGIVHDFYELVL